MAVRPAVRLAGPQGRRFHDSCICDDQQRGMPARRHSSSGRRCCRCAANRLRGRLWNSVAWLSSGPARLSVIQPAATAASSHNVPGTGAAKCRPQREQRRTGAGRDRGLGSTVCCDRGGAPRWGGAGWGRPVVVGLPAGCSTVRARAAVLGQHGLCGPGASGNRPCRRVVGVLATAERPTTPTARAHAALLFCRRSPTGRVCDWPIEVACVRSPLPACTGARVPR